MAKIHDISMPIAEDMPVYEGDPRFWRYEFSRPCESAPESYGMTVLTLGSHTGTHVDAPRHFVPDGVSVSDIGLDVLCGPARVVDLRAAGLEIDEAALRQCNLQGVERLLLKTTNGDLLGKPFTRDHAHLTLSGALYLRQHTAVRLVGIDYFSIEAYLSPGFPVHRTLLEGPSPLVIVEGLDLRAVPAGDHELFCLPLRIEGCDGAPARAMLVERDR